METKRRQITLPKTTATSDGRPGTSTLLAASSTSKAPISYRLVPVESTVTIKEEPSTSGQYLVMLPNSEVLQSNVKRPSEETFPKTGSESKRRAIHKEIERRRRDQINDWILVLSKEVPECLSDQTKQGQSKGGILAKTARYIADLRAENEKMAEVIAEKEELSAELERTRQLALNAADETQRLRTLLQEANIPIPPPPKVTTKKN